MHEKHCNNNNINNKITTTWAVLQARIAAGIPAPAVAVPAVTPPALVNIEFDSV